MKQVLVTGAKGFIGQNLCLVLRENKDIELTEYDIKSEPALLKEALLKADFIFHLAGVNRPKNPEEFKTGNHGLTKEIVDFLIENNKRPTLIITSSTQALLDNPYGVSKREAEDEVKRYKEATGSSVFPFRLTNVFGKWSRPFYNSVVATFCHQAAHNEPFKIDDRTKLIEFIYIDDIIRSFMEILENPNQTDQGDVLSINPSYSITIGDLADKLERIKEMRVSCVIPNFDNLFDKYLYSTYLSYLEKDNFIYSTNKKVDNRGYLFEFIKSSNSGQMFVSRTLPGITRGNHYHHTKVEKFCVVEGKAKIAFRQMVTGERIEYIVEGQECKVVDIPPGWTHSITNISDSDLITIFWANEIFNQEKPDTFFSEV